MPKKKTNDLVPMKENKLLVEVMIGGFMGALAGIIIGLFVGVIIWAVSTILQLILLSNTEVQYLGIMQMGTLGMTWGAALLGIFGCIAGLKQQK